MRTASQFSSVSGISEAIILMAGSGSRLRRNGFSLAKPLIEIRGRPLISYTMDALVRAGIKTLHAVVGFEREALMAQMGRLIPKSLEMRFIVNRHWKKQNGISVLAAANKIDSPFLLTMGDHLFDQSIIDLLVREAERSELTLAIDKKLNSIFDLDDAMKIQTCGDRVIAVGKDLPSYDAIDTGLFVCPADIFIYLERARQNDDCSLADGVRLMAGEDKVRGLDIGEAWWQDVDTPEMLQRAEEQMQTLAQFK
jgi:1L-myo-inositol 1-phosphate cytidylyltransferase